MHQKLPSWEALSAPDWWRALCPGLSITDGPLTWPGAPVALATPAREAMNAQLGEEGYCLLPPMLTPEACAAMAEGAHRVVARGLPADFLMLYDAPWRAFHAFAGVLADALGGAATLLADFGVWVVDPSKNQRGYTPHRDLEAPRRYNRPDGSPELLTLWCPVTDATLDNSCLYVLPTNHDGGLPAILSARSVAEIEEVRAPQPAELPFVRALPCAAGSLLLFNQYLLHWGAAGRPGAPPRVSISIYAQDPTLPDFLPGIRVPTGAPVSFERRLAIVAREVLKYALPKLDFITDEPPYPPELLALCERALEGSGLSP